MGIYDGLYPCFVSYFTIYNLFSKVDLHWSKKTCKQTNGKEKKRGEKEGADKTSDEQESYRNKGKQLGTSCQIENGESIYTSD